MKKRKRLQEILLSDNVSESILDNIAYIINIMPEICYMIDFEHKHPHHHLDVFKHTLLALDNSKCDLEIRMALLLHDIGKPFSYQNGDDIRHFRGHVEVSTKIANLILKRLNYEAEFIQNVLYLISTHDNVINLSKLDNSILLISKRLEVQYADAKAHAPNKVEMRMKILDRIKQGLNEKETLLEF